VTEDSKISTRVPVLIFAACCVALNVAVGTVVYLLKLTLYLDQPGIMLAALLVPGTWRSACIVSSIVAIVTFTSTALLVNPFNFWYYGTGIASAIYGSLVVRGRLSLTASGPQRQWMKVIAFGIGWGVVAALVSAPVTAYLFGGVTGVGTTLIVAYLLKTGLQVLNAVLLTGLGAEPIDKTISLIIALAAARATPSAFMRQLSRNS
jgi:energy-coupling factor transport system substrate-specific component